ncbi:MAG: chloride channel protein [Clostridiaceae bacterium]|nr:chloride channel protein [Clostridiaceae bacterium]
MSDKYVISNIKDLSKSILKWVCLSILLGVLVGLIVGFFDTVLSKANSFRKEHNNIIYFLPLAGIIISFIYVHVQRNAYTGENLLKSEVQKAAKDIPLYMVPVSFLGSLITTFFGGSAGKEGAGIAMGGTLADFFARIFKLKDDEQKSLVIACVGSAYGVLYDVPFAGALLGMELVLKGGFNYAALIPSFLTSVIASRVAELIGKKSIEYPTLTLGNLNGILILKIVALGILFGFVGMLFNFILDNSSKVYNLITKNPYVKGFLGGVFTIILFWIAGDNYNGLGNSYIAKSFAEQVSIFDFMWKIIFTAVALGSVFQGGRGNPTFFVGATFGSAIAGYFNLPLESVAALSMIGVFCSAASLPITSIVIAIEYFGADESLAIILIMTICYVVSGFYDILTKRKLTAGKSTLFKAMDDKVS